MELRVLQYFLAITREQSISGAAEALHLSQPTLSRQIKEMEEELGKQLFIRGNRRIILTEEGMILRKRAEEIMELVKKAEDEISWPEEIVAGNITVGAGETNGVHFLTKAARAVQNDHPLVHFHIISGDKATVSDSMDKGLIDFGLFFGKIDASKYEYIRLPYTDTWGVLMRRDSPLAQKESISAEDLPDKPLIVSRQALQEADLQDFFRLEYDKLNIVGTYNLLFNGSLMVEDGMGYALCLDHIINVSGNGNLCFRPFSPKWEAEMFLAWKKYQILPKAAERFLQKLREIIGANSAQL